MQRGTLCPRLGAHHVQHNLQRLQLKRHLLAHVGQAARRAAQQRGLDVVLRRGRRMRLQAALQFRQEPAAASVLSNRCWRAPFLATVAEAFMSQKEDYRQAT